MTADNDPIQNWHDVLSGRKTPADTTSPIEQEAKLLRDAILRQPPVEGIDEVDIDAALSAAIEQVRNEGLKLPQWQARKAAIDSIVQLPAKRSAWYRQPTLAIAATLVLAVGIGMAVRQELQNPELTFERGATQREERIFAVEYPQRRAQEIAAEFESAGIEAKAFESMGLWIVDIQVKPEQLDKLAVLLRKFDLGEVPRGDLRLVFKEKN